MYDLPDLKEKPDVPGNYVDYKDAIFDDEAEIAIEEGDAPFTGRFRPKAGNLLKIFDSEDAYGLWRLQIYDAFYADIGTLKGIELVIMVPEPLSVILLAFGAAFIALPRTRRRG